MRIRATRAAGCFAFSDERRLVLSCAMDRPQDTFARVIGTEGEEIRVTNPYHIRMKVIGSRSLQRAGDAERFQSEAGEIASLYSALQHSTHASFGTRTTAPSGPGRCHGDCPQS